MSQKVDVARDEDILGNDRDGVAESASTSSSGESV